MIGKLLFVSGVLTMGSLLIAIWFGIFGRYDIGTIFFFPVVIGMTGIFIFGILFAIKEFKEE